MTPYSLITIDGVDVYFDPESISVTTGNLIGINRSMGGTYYLTSTSINSNTPAVNRTVSIAGVLIPSHYAALLLAKSSNTETVLVGGGILGTEGSFIITSMNISPSKPRFDYPGTYGTDVKYAYTVALQEVDPA